MAAPVAATSPVQSATATSGPGKRRAAKPTRHDRAAARDAERSAQREAQQRAAREAARAEAVRKAEAQAAREAARESARATVQPVARGNHTGGRKSLFPALPSAPTLVGAAALAFAAVGATVSQQSASTPDEFQKFASQASVLNAATSIGSSDAVSGRKRAVSRDSEREALKDAADAELLAAAEDQAKERDAALAALAASAEKHAKVIARNAWQFALPSGSYRVSYNYGQCSYLWSNCHTGEDFSAPYGTTIYNIAAGTVTSAGYDGSYGNKTVVTLEDGTELWYCHQSSMNVSVGQTVEPGQAIGAIGTTGNTTGPHLHLEVRPGGGDPVDPLSTLAVHGVTP
ncbi:M23 family metallopeptidase [Nocardioides iriomotensis]|uniref:M23 family metallopeptidase n=1 Tax=Nocardioides iriomotensis TaxID=715784 RepID=A0A4Q5JA33_9ACTN|nr:M23 family metallopeptidase [Nocardioides iriomotensis]RYU15602.1 M23 family metallopeptidase [Nocardioides iriomotensis]